MSLLHWFPIDSVEMVHYGPKPYIKMTIKIPQTYCHSFKEAVDGEGKDDEGGSKVGDRCAFILPFLLCIWTWGLRSGGHFAFPPSLSLQQYLELGVARQGRAEACSSHCGPGCHSWEYLPIELYLRHSDTHMYIHSQYHLIWCEANGMAVMGRIVVETVLVPVFCLQLLFSLCENETWNRFYFSQ